MQPFERILLENKAWAQDMHDHNPGFFKQLAKQQKPEFLWIGCSDSRVPADKITGTQPGEIFVHRNIANLVVNTDVNLLSVLQYAVEVLQVKEVIVCGHYGCGGVKAAFGNQYLGVINQWIKELKDLYKVNRNEIDAIADENERVNKLVEISIMDQVQNLAKTYIIQKSWKHHNAPRLHGWVYGLESGLLKPLIQINPGEFTDPIYKYENIDHN